MTVSTHLGFKPEFRTGSAKEFTRKKYVVADAAFHEGDVVNLESNQVDLAVAGDQGTIIGVVSETKSGMTTGTDVVEVYTDPDLVFSVYDAVARDEGAVLDISGATGAMTVTTKSSDNLVVYAKSLATERTFVRWNIGAHLNGSAQT